MKFMSELKLRPPKSYDQVMKLARPQVLGSLLLGLIVLVMLVIRAWPLLFPSK